MRRQPKPVRSVVFQALKSRSVVGCQPMIRSVVCRVRWMTWQASRTISPMKRRNREATYLRRPAGTCVISGNSGRIDTTTAKQAPLGQHARVANPGIGSRKRGESAGRFFERHRAFVPHLRSVSPFTVPVRCGASAYIGEGKLSGLGADADSSSDDEERRRRRVPADVSAVAVASVRRITPAASRTNVPAVPRKQRSGDAVDTGVQRGRLPVVRGSSTVKLSAGP